ncbi:MAG: hypothetical protein LBC46_04905 [Treponema sp.]|jgi:hypothetical protein|nr:hypothetical protein [Treponema sp.]
MSSLLVVNPEHRRLLLGKTGMKHLQRYMIPGTNVCSKPEQVFSASGKLVFASNEVSFAPRKMFPDRQKRAVKAP